METRIVEYIENKLKSTQFGKGNLLAYQMLVKLASYWLVLELNEEEIKLKIDFLTNEKNIGTELPEDIYNKLRIR